MIKLSGFLMLFSLITGAMFAHADAEGSGSNGTEYMYQTPGDTFMVQPQIGMGALVTKFNDTNSGYKNLKSTTASFPVGVSGEYGINQMLAIGLDLIYSSAKRTYDCDSPLPCPKDKKISGLEDPAINIKLRNQIGAGTLRYGLQANIGIEKSKVDKDGNTNAASGGSSVTPFVGYELPLGPGFIGARASYELYKGDRKTKFDGESDETKTTGGQLVEVSAFYEANVGIMTYGGALVFDSKAESKSADGSEAATGNKDAYTQYTVHFYTPAHLTPTITILPTLDLGGISYTSSDSVADSAGLVLISVAGRFTF